MSMRRVVAGLKVDAVDVGEASPRSRSARARRRRGCVPHRRDVLSGLAAISRSRVAVRASHDTYADTSVGASDTAAGAELALGRRPAPRIPQSAERLEPCLRGRGHVAQSGRAGRTIRRDVRQLGRASRSGSFRARGLVANRRETRQGGQRRRAARGQRENRSRRHDEAGDAVCGQSQFRNAHPHHPTPPGRIGN